MTPETLQKKLCAELGSVMKNIAFQDENGDRTKLNIFPQCLPRKHNEEDPDPFPFCIVKLGDNDVVSMDTDQKAAVILYFGIYYENEDCQYQHTMLTMMEAVKRRFLENPILDEFSCDPVMKCVLDDEDEGTYPHYFGGMSLVFNIPNYKREDDFC